MYAASFKTEVNDKNGDTILFLVMEKLIRDIRLVKRIEH